MDTKHMQSPNSRRPSQQPLPTVVRRPTESQSQTQSTRPLSPQPARTRNFTKNYIQNYGATHAQSQTVKTYRQDSDRLRSQYRPDYTQTMSLNLNRTIQRENPSDLIREYVPATHRTYTLPREEIYRSGAKKRGGGTWQTSQRDSLGDLERDTAIPEEEAYPSDYGEEDSAIVREFSPAAQQREEQAAQAKPRRKKADRRALLEKRLSLVVAGLLSFCFIAAVALLALLPRSTKSMIEKRELASFPLFSLQNYFSGEFTAGVATFYDDTVPYRDDLKNAGNNFKALFGLPASENSVEIVGNIQKVDKKPAGDNASQAQPPAQGSSPGESPAPAQSTAAPADPGPAVSQIGTGMDASLEGAAGRRMEIPTPPPAENPFRQADEVDNGGNGVIVVKQAGHYRGMEPYYGTSDMAEGYVAGLNQLHSQLGDSVKLWSMPAPLACQFYLPDSHSEYSTDQSQCFDQVHAQLNGVQGINICPVLSQHVEEPIYCRTDHHWQPLGAYYAAQAFAQAAGVPFDDLNTYTPGKVEGFVGSMYSFSESAKLLNDPEDFTYYTPGSPYTATYYTTALEPTDLDDTDLFAQGVDSYNAYEYYLHGDQYIVKVDTQVQNGRKLLIIKDSYGNAEVPFLVGSFQQIYVADVRYLERNLVSFAKDLGITDVLFTLSAFSLVGDNGDNINTLITQNAGETVALP